MKIDAIFIVISILTADASMTDTTVTMINAVNSETIMTIIEATNDNAVINDAEDMSSVSMTALESLQNDKCFFQCL